MRRRLPILLVLLPLLLGYSECGYWEAPEASAVLLSDPAAIERLRRDHAEAIGYLEGENGGPVPAGSVTAGHLEKLPGALRSVKAYSSGRLVRSAPAGSMGCPSVGAHNEECFVFELELKLKRLVRPRQPRTVWFAFWETGEENGEECDRCLPPHAAVITDDGKTIELTPEARQVLTDALLAALGAVEAYSDAAELELGRILGALLACPAGTVYERTFNVDEDSGRAHWCEKPDGTLHGPWMSGNLSELLAGVRQIEGRYQDGEKQGEWVFRDPGGAEQKRESWEKGTPVEGAGPPPGSE